MKKITADDVAYYRERLFEMACAGETNLLETYWSMTDNLNVTCNKYGREHSLIMGAFRNRQWDTVSWLLEHGAKLTKQEQEEVNNRYMEMILLFEMQDVTKKGDSKWEKKPVS